MGKTVEIECAAEIEIDEYVTEISDSVLIEEALIRMDNLYDTERKKELLDMLLSDDEVTVDAIASSKNLNIIDTQRLRNFLNDLG